MSARPVSVVVVSCAGPAALERSVTALLQMVYPSFEIVAVASADKLARVEEISPKIKRVPFEAANKNAARNAGLAVAGGEIVAFLDDTAVPEPSWLTFLAAAFERPDISAAGGFIRGHDGISFLGGARSVDQNGRSLPIETKGEAVLVPDLPEGHAVWASGTNMAARRAALLSVGGFDPGFQGAMGAADLNIRMAQRGFRTALVPLAEVHQAGQGQSDQAARFYRQGAALALFLAKHGGDLTAWPEYRTVVRQGLLTEMVRGACEPSDVARCLKALDRGWAEGQSHHPGAPFAQVAVPLFRPLPQGSGESTVISGWIWQAGRLRREAAAAVKKGGIVTLILLSPSLRFHRVRYAPEGYWEHRGGLWGKAERDDPLIQRFSYENRVSAEVERVTVTRAISNG